MSEAVDRFATTNESIPFSALLFQVENEKLYTPYIPTGNPEQSTAAYRPLGLPMDPMSNLPPVGLESPMINYDTSMPAMSGLDGIWDKLTQNSESAIDWAYSGIERGIKGVYGKAKDAVSTVVSDVTTPLENELKSTYLYLLLGVVVIGGALYYIGKGGAVKVRV